VLLRWLTPNCSVVFGDTVRVDYFDLFDPACPALPPGSALPVVLINGQVFSNGGKISIPAIRKHLATQNSNEVTKT